MENNSEEFLFFLSRITFEILLLLYVVYHDDYDDDQSLLVLLLWWGFVTFIYLWLYYVIISHRETFGQIFPFVCELHRLIL